MASASRPLKNITLELGGNSASIVSPDADVKFVVSQVAVSSSLALANCSTSAALNRSQFEST